MTTAHHTAVEAGLASRAPVNAALEQLDSAIVTVEGRVNAFAGSAGSGAGWATTLNGTAASGQKVVPVASTTGAAVGMPVYLGLTSGTHEVGVIASVQAGVSVTLVANLASTYSSGAPISTTPAEVADARGGFAVLADRFASIESASVKLFGAKGDGTTDDTAAVQAAQATGAHVYFPPGTYALKGTIAANVAGQRFYGPGVVTFDPGGVRSNAVIELFRVTADRVTFDGLTFDGLALAGYSIAAPASDWMIVADAAGTKYGRIVNCAFRRMSRPAGHLASCVGVLGQGSSTGWRVTGNVFETLGGGAIFLQACDSLAMGNVIDTCGDVPIAINGEQTRGCSVIGNTILNTDQYAAIAVEEATYDWTITGNTIRGCQRGFHVMHSLSAGPAAGGGIFADNEIIDTTTGISTDNFAVHIASAYYRDIVIRGNRFAGLTAKTASTAFIYASVATSGLVVEDNLFEAKAQAVSGIIFTATGHDRTRIRRNTFRSTGTGANRMTRGVWSSGAWSFDGADISANHFENNVEGVRFDGAGYAGTIGGNTFAGTATAYIAIPGVGTVTTPPTPHAYVTAGNATSAVARVETDQSLTGNNSFVDLATVGPAVTITVNTKVMVTLTVRAFTAAANQNPFAAMGFAASGANTIAAANARAVFMSSGASGGDVQASASFMLTGLTPGSTVFTAKYSQLAASGTTHWLSRELSVVLLD